MNKNKLRSIIKDLTEQKAPAAHIDLWPAIQSRVQMSQPTRTRGTTMNMHSNSQHRRLKNAYNRRLKPASILLAIALIGAVFLLPQGRAFAQSVLHFFTRSENNQLPIQAGQLTPPPAAETPTDDPASIIDANQNMAEVRQAAGFQVYEPAWIPAGLQFSGASIEPDHKIVRIFYQYVETNGLVFRQQSIPITDDCELCGKVGADAAIQEVSIAGIYGEYAEGVWKLTDSGPVWEPDPYLKTMRWQENRMAFELLYMGPPGTLSQEEMVAIAESLK